MARTVLTPQPMNVRSGINPAWTPVDTVNLMQCKNTGIERVLVATGSASAVTITLPSVACSHGRTGDIVVTLGANVGGEFFGPFDPAIWGDGAANLYINPSALSGTASVAVIVH